LGWLADPKRPRMFSCQSSGCAPIARAFDAGERFATPAVDPHTRAFGLRVPAAVGDFLILDAVRASNGRAMSVDEERLDEWMRLAARSEGVSLCPESAICLGVLERALADGHIHPEESIVLFNTGAAQKYVELLEVELPRIDRNAVDWDAIAD
jgi:threonine synthase